MTIEQIIERIIEQEIFVNASTMVTDLCDEGSHWSEHLVDCMGAPDYSEPPEGYAVDYQGPYGYTWADDEGNAATDFETQDEAIRAAWEDSGEEPEIQEALQFWLVSDWLADKLEQAGAPLARDVLGFNVWGRTECGQSLTMDGTLHAVAALIK